MAVYQLNRPSIEKIIDYCKDLEAGSKLEVYPGCGEYPSPLSFSAGGGMNPLQDNLFL